ncbi:ABC1 kinase family protein [Ramlibacter pallidus]|uniref:Ubiquinone biosynthesis protein UbiB n=1 Tax=Ramlibacter pallidus TaxID=2780087 RepID=A0ABR9RXT9_9BURK|nr:AarF/UbiB family protein [Ramlibacter pallidus]MBE7366045.1 ubiquinone biosynthesis protein UbiB [Ramlibacter pallidus]
MLWQALLSVRDAGRLYDIASTLVRYGFGDVVRRAGLADMLERAGRALHWQHAEEFAHLPPAARVRRAMEELGPTFVKLGQVLATRIDLFDPEWIAEFSRLHDGSLALPFDAVREQMVEDLGCDPEEAFATFDPDPLATGSLAQVYRARLHDGTAVIVKVRRPGILPVVEADLRLLARLAQLAEGEIDSLRAFRPVQMVREFTQSLRREMDFASEARNGRRVAENFAAYSDGGGPSGPLDQPGTLELEPVIVIPAVYWESERLCVQEQVTGIPGTRLADVDAAGLDRRLLARRGARAVLKMILTDGFYHADPHPGNVFYLPGNRIAFIDFGMVGRLPEERREQLVRLLLGLVKHDADAVADVLMDWTGKATVDVERLVEDIGQFVDQYRGLPLRQLRLGEMLGEVVRMLREYRLVLPSDLALLIKAFITLEGMGRELDPDFNMAGEALPVLEHAMREHYAPDAVLARGWRSARQVLSLLGGLPQDLSRLLRAARAGRLDIRVDVPQLGQAGNQVDRAASRLSMAIVIAALIIGSSIVMTVPGGPSLLGLPFFGLLGFVGAVVGSLWLIVSIARSGKA